MASAVTPVIYCDEAGNSGANLLDPEQPFFVLASNNYTAEEAIELLELVRSPQGGEPKFSTLRKSNGGRERLRAFLQHDLIRTDRIFTDTYHKRFMVVTKMVDLIAETLIHKVGGDLYERGANIAMSNMLFGCMPVFCSEEVTTHFLQSFVRLIRDPQLKHVLMFHDAGRQMIERSSSEPFKRDLDWFTNPSFFDDWWDDHINWSSLDPAIPALFNHVVEWGSRQEDRFHIVHDSSKPILATQHEFEEMMALEGEASTEIGRDRRKIQFPLRALSLSQAPSDARPQLQIADLCAGITNHFFKARLSQKTDDLTDAAEAAGVGAWGSGLFAGVGVSPEELGTADTKGTNSVEEMQKYLAKRRGLEWPKAEDWGQDVRDD